MLDTLGSAWWKGVNGDFIYWSQLAALAFEEGQSGLDWELPVRRWLDYLERPGAVTWYQAHNASIIEGYRTRVGEANQEPETERVFMNIVLYRLLFAEALVEDVTPFGGLGRILADPRLPAVQAMVCVPNFYPTSYPLTAKEFAEVTGNGGFSLAEIAVRVLDRLLLAPHIEELYKAAATWTGVGEVMTMQTENVPTYPVGVAAERSPNARVGGKKQKIAILGGGVASLAAAWELTSYGGWESDYEITLYQLGWRCGGKAGGGRGPQGRVEELGLHLLLGFYVNAFPMFQEAYDERTRLGLWPTARYKTLPEAVAPNWGALLVNYDGGARVWNNWPMIFPPSPGYPGDGPPLSTWQLLRRGVASLLETILGSPYGEKVGPLARWLLGHFFPMDGGQDRGSFVGAGLLAATPEAEVLAVLRELEQEPEAPALAVGVGDALGPLFSLLRWVLRKVVGDTDQIDPEQARQLREGKIDLESPWSGWKGKPFQLERGKDFDLLILGIPAKAQRYICREIIEQRPDWRAMVDNIRTAQVMSAQLWLRPTLRELGYEPAAWGMKEGVTAPNVVTYQNPMFSWLDQSCILPNESWTGEKPQVLAMFTGVLPDLSEVPPPGPSDFPERQRERVKQLTWQWLMDNMGWFFSKATTGPTRRASIFPCSSRSPRRPPARWRATSSSGSWPRWRRPTSTCWRSPIPSSTGSNRGNPASRTCTWSATGPTTVPTSATWRAAWCRRRRRSSASASANSRPPSTVPSGGIRSRTGHGA